MSYLVVSRNPKNTLSKGAQDRGTLVLDVHEPGVIEVDVVSASQYSVKLGVRAKSREAVTIDRGDKL